MEIMMKRQKYDRCILHIAFAVFVATAMSVLAIPQDLPFQLKAVSPRRIVVGDKPVITLCENGKINFEVVKPANPDANKALSEFIDMMFQITGAKVKPVEKASGNVPAFYLGTCPEAKEIGLEPETLDRDGFFIKTDKNRIFITGCDSKNKEKIQNATLYGVFDFFERFAGVRYYFPGEIGTIVPKEGNWKLPDIDITERPDAQFRWVYCNSNKKLSPNLTYEYPGMKERHTLTWRDSTLKSIRSCHGLNDLHLVERFAKTNPEFFALTKDGRRQDGSWNKTSFHAKGHLCYSSKGLRDEIYKDIVASLTGQPASTRGLKSWSSRWNRMHVDLAPNDGMEWCLCPECKKIKEQGRQAMSDHIWGFAADMANRLKRDGIPGFVMLGGYSFWAPTPSFKLPDNILLGMAVAGPWGMENETTREYQMKMLRDWSKVSDSRVRSWNYPTKAVAPVPIVPNFTPRAVGAFYKESKDYIFGAFFEAGSDRWMYGFLNYYVFSKVMWDYDTDVEALIDEHCRLMYGSAASQMNQFYKMLEDFWMKNIVKERVPTTHGDMWKIPTRRDIWTKIISPAKIQEINALFDSAEKAVAQEPEALKRLLFMKNELWQPVLNGAKAFNKEVADRSAWTIVAGNAENITLDGKLDEDSWKKATPVWLNKNRHDTKVEVYTRVKMLKDKDYFYFGFDAEEHQTEKMYALMERKPDDTEVWRDNGCEVFISAELSSDFIYQFIFNSSGLKSDLRNTVYKTDSRFESGFEVKTQIEQGKGWTAEVRVPRASMPELEGRTTFVANFVRHRVLANTKVSSEYYSWFPKKRNIPEDFAIVRLEASEQSKNLIKTGDFDKPIKDNKYIGPRHWVLVGKNPKQITVDREEYLTNGVSLLLQEGSSGARQYLPLEPGKKYKLSFFVKTEELMPGLRALLRFGGDSTPVIYALGDFRDYIRGTNQWYRVEKVFRAPEKFGKRYQPFVEFFIGGSKGKGWVDHVELYKVD